MQVLVKSLDGQVMKKFYEVMKNYWSCEIRIKLTLYFHSFELSNAPFFSLLVFSSVFSG